MDKFYLFRSTTAHLSEHLERIEESGDAVVSCQFMGEKHWLIVCRKGEWPQVSVSTLGDAAARYVPGGVS